MVVISPSLCRPSSTTDIYARETGSNKQAASKSCSLSIVRQLYHLNVIEPFSGTLKKKESEKLKPYEVVLVPDLVTQLDGVIKATGVQPMHTVGDGAGSG